MPRDGRANSPTVRSATSFCCREKPHQLTRIAIFPEPCMIPSADNFVILPLNNQTAVITGAGSAEGIGFAVARPLHAERLRALITSTTHRTRPTARELYAPLQHRFSF